MVGKWKFSTYAPFRRFGPGLARDLSSTLTFFAAPSPPTGLGPFRLTPLTCAEAEGADEASSFGIGVSDGALVSSLLTCCFGVGLLVSYGDVGGMEGVGFAFNGCASVSDGYLAKADGGSRRTTIFFCFDFEVGFEAANGAAVAGNAGVNVAMALGKPMSQCQHGDISTVVNRLGKGLCRSHLDCITSSTDSDLLGFSKYTRFPYAKEVDDEIKELLYCIEDAIDSDDDDYGANRDAAESEVQVSL